MIAELFQGIADTLFGSDGIPLMALIKFGLFIMIFFGVFKGAEKIFSENKGIPLLIAAIISLIAVRMIPEEIQRTLGTVIIGVLSFFGPYVLVSFLSDLFRLGRTVKWILVIILYSALIYFLPYLLSSIAIPAYGGDALESLFEYMADYQMITFGVFVGILAALILVRRRIYGGMRGGAGLLRRGLGGGAGLFRGGLRAVGRAGIGAARGARNMGRYGVEGAAFGAGAAGGYAAGRTRGWWARRRAARAGGASTRGSGTPAGGRPNIAVLQRQLKQLEAILPTLFQAMVKEKKMTGIRGSAYRKWFGAYKRAQALRAIPGVVP